MPASVALTHLPFFEALAAESDEQSTVWRQLSAGLLTMRLFDAWLRHVRRGEPAPETAWLMAAREAVKNVGNSRKAVEKELGK